MTTTDFGTRLEDIVRHSAPGVAVVVFGPEGVRASAACGLADLAAHEPMTTEHSMPWFSMTKVATATVVMKLVEGQRLDLDAPVRPLVPAMEPLRPLDRAGRVTARHLLQHAAGLPNPIPVRWIHAPEDPAPEPETFLASLLAKHSKLRFEPGERSSYSNLGTLVLGSLITQVTGQHYVDVVRDEVLGPLGMSDTSYTWDPSRAATGYHPRRSPLRLLLPRWVEGPSTGRWMSLEPFLLDGAAYGGLVGTAADAALFARMHLRDGELDGHRLLSPSVAAQMRSVTSRGRRLDLGLGWFVPAGNRDADPPFVEHLGGGAGFFDVMRLYPSAEVGVVVMGNATRYDVDAVAALALDQRIDGWGPTR